MAWRISRCGRVRLHDPAAQCARIRGLARVAGRAGGAIICGMAGSAVAVSAVSASSVASMPASGSRDWPAYLDGPSHTSYSRSQTLITAATAAHLVQVWHYGPNLHFSASPTIADGAVFMGSGRGWFYKLSETTGAVLHKRFTGYLPAKTCGAQGTVSTATVATDPAGHGATVYVAGADGYLYALSASNLSLRWRAVIALPSASVSDYFDWSSPTVANGKIYVGVSSRCDNPLIRGGVIAFDQASGRKLAEFYTVPSGDVGGSVWSSAAVAPDGDVFVSTGNGPITDQLLGYSESIIKLNPQSLKVLGSFQVPAAQIGNDSDFGASPIVFGKYVGACNKNGIFYLLNQSTMTVRWERRIGDPYYPGATGQCIATPAYNGKWLYFGGNQVTIRGVIYGGSVQERRPGSGSLKWETGLPDGVDGSPSMDGGGILAVPTAHAGSQTANGVYLVTAASGRIVRLLVQGPEFAQCVFARNRMYSANNKGVFAWAVKKAA